MLAILSTERKKVDCFVYKIATPTDFYNFWVLHGFYDHEPAKTQWKYLLFFQMKQAPDLYLKIIAAKTGALLAIGVISFICGVLPYYSIRSFRNRFPTSTVQHITSGFICFSAGTLLGVTFLHLLPEIRDKIAQLQSSQIFSFPKSLPLSDIIAMAGFFGVYLLDEILHMGVEWYSLRMKHRKMKSATKNKTETVKPGRVCSQLPHDISVFSLDNHENSKHHVIISRRSNHRAAPAPSCVCQTQKTNAIEATDEKEIVSVNEESENSGGKLEKGKEKQPEEIPCCSKSQIMSPLSGLITIAALSFHDIFEGIAIGVEHDLKSILFLFLSIASHKYAIAFCIGMDLAAAGSKLKMIVLSMMTFSVVSPIGVIIGMIVVSKNSGGQKYEIESPASVVMQGIAGGTLIYVVCFEVLQREGTDTHKKGIQNVMFVICGFLVTLGFKILTGPSHSQ